MVVLHVRESYVCAVLQVPVPISEQRRTFLAMKFLRGATFRGDKQVRMWERLARECIAASNNEVGLLIKSIVN